MATAGNITVSLEDNPVKEVQASVPEGKEPQTSVPESTDEPTKSQPKKDACSRMALALLAGAFVIAAAAATAVVVGVRLLDGQGASSDSGIGEPDPIIPGISGSLVLRAADPAALVGDGRFQLAVATAVASTLTSQTGGNVTADNVQVTVSTRRLATMPSLRGFGRRLEGNSLVVDYTVYLDGGDVPKPEDATRVLRAVDPAAMTTKIVAEMTLQGFEQDMSVEVISISAEILGEEGEESEQPDVAEASDRPDRQNDTEGVISHPDHPENSSSPFGDDGDQEGDGEGHGEESGDEGNQGSGEDDGGLDDGNHEGDQGNGDGEGHEDEGRDGDNGGGHNGGGHSGGGHGGSGGYNGGGHAGGGSNGDCNGGDHR